MSHEARVVCVHVIAVLPVCRSGESVSCDLAITGNEFWSL